MIQPRTKAELDLILAGINAPFKSGNIPTLGGPEKASLYICVSIDPRETWANGILENSTYFRFCYDYQGKLEVFSGFSRIKRFRKCSPKNAQDALDRINKYLAEVSI